MKKTPMTSTELVQWLKDGCFDSRFADAFDSGEEGDIGCYKQSKRQVFLQRGNLQEQYVATHCNFKIYYGRVLANVGKKVAK